MRAHSIRILALCLWVSSLMAAQTPEPAGLLSSSQTPAALPPAPSPQPSQQLSWHPSPNDSYLTRAGVLCGSGASTSLGVTKPTSGCGLGITLLPLPFFFELGVMGPQAHRSSYSGYISLDGDIPLGKRTAKYLPMAIVGYSRLFETGHAFDYGVALGLPRFGNPKDPTSSLRLELRDYWTFANPTQHNVMLRIGWMGAVSD